MPQRSDIDGIVKALLVMAFGGWSASIAYTGKGIIDTQKRMDGKLHAMELRLALAERDVTDAKNAAELAERMAQQALDVKVQHGKENAQITERILRLESKQ